MQQHSSFFTDLKLRELNGFNVRKRPCLGDFSSDPSVLGAGVLFMEHGGKSTPPTALSFSQSTRCMPVLAVADDDGYVTIFNSRRRLPSYASSMEKTSQAQVCDWSAHNNSIFDVCWIKDDSQILTASGDQRVKIWNTEKKACIGTLAGHSGSVKAISPHSTNQDLIVSGSRDGSFAIWDLRCNHTSTNRLGESCLPSIADVKHAHASTKLKGGRPKKGSAISITSVLYLKDEITVATAGSVDSVVKFWDTRNLRSAIIQAGPSEPSNSKEGAHHGVTSLSQDSHGASLVASCLDNRIYLYDVFQLDKGPKKIFSGSHIENFFVKSVISPDGTHILGGSTDGNAYIWQAAKPERPPVMLKGHEEEVTAVAWCSSDVGKIATSSDDFMVRIWNTKKESCLTPTTPAAMRKRITAPLTECRKLVFDEPTMCHTTKVADDDNGSSKEPSSPAENNQVEFSTPECQKKRSFVSLMAEEIVTRKSPEAALTSPSSVLNPPSSLKRKTIRDYFTTTIL